MSILFPSVLKEIIDKDYHSAIGKTNLLTIREEQVGAKCQWVNIQLKNSLSSFVFSIDFHRKLGEKDPVFPFLNVKKEGLCSKNDAVLVCQKEHKIFVFLIELKSINKGKYLHQLKSTKILFDFIVNRIELIDTSVKKEQIEYRGILFFCSRRGTEEATRKKFKVTYENRNGLLVAEKHCHNTYRIQQFLP